MKKKFAVLSIVLLVGVLIFGMIGTGAWWTVQTQALDNTYQAATFDMTINGQHTVTGLCGVQNWAPGDDPYECKVPLLNASTIPINVVWSGFGLSGDTVMQDWVFVTDFADSNGQTQLSDIMGFDSNHDGKLSIKEASVAIGNGYFSNPDGTYSASSIFLPAGGEGWVSITLAFGAGAPNSTIGKSVEFDWSLTAQQLPKNPTP